MINYLKGTITYISKNTSSGCSITVEVNNIGYQVLTSKKAVDNLAISEEIVTIHTSLIHKEDAMYLCGFLTREDRDLFNILQSVSGIGTKVALTLLGELGAQELISAVIRGDDKTLSRTKGVGPKLAQRVILELKDKMTNWRDRIEPESIKSLKFENQENRESYLETQSVLLSLGYLNDEINQSLEHALNIAKDKGDAEELLRIALQWLSSN